MRQLPLAIGDPPARSFDNFVAGANALTLDHLHRLRAPAMPVYLWGPSGAGKTHLLQALADQMQRQGARISWFDLGVPQPWVFDERCTLIVLDDCDRFDATQQHAAFALFVEAATHESLIAAAGRLPPIDLPLRDDLRSRLGWGHVFAVEALGEPETRAALRREADQRSVFLSDDVMDYLLTRFSRNLKDLMTQVDRLDEFSRATKRAITVPLLKQMIAEEGESTR